MGGTDYSQYDRKRKPEEISQKHPLSDKQVKNSAGGYVFQIDKWQRLARFLILGSEGGTYYASEREITEDNVKNIIDCIKEDGIRVVQETIRISDQGLAPKNDPAIFLLALALKHGNNETKQFVMDNIDKVARIGTHILTFVKYSDNMRGWGRGLKKAVAKWYLNKTIDQLAFQTLKYQKREGWAHRDVIRLTHMKAEDFSVADPNQVNALFKWIVNDEISEGLVPYITDYEEILKATSEQQVVDLVLKNEYSWEMVPTQWRKSQVVWNALLPTLGYTALIRNLGNLSKIDMLTTSNSNIVQFVVEKITNEENIKQARMHPIQILLALKNYGAGSGYRGSGEWGVVRSVLDALETAFYLSFKYLESTGKRILVAQDVSTSMDSRINNTNLSAKEASAAMAMSIIKSETNVDVVAFDNGGSEYWARPGIQERNVMKNYNLSQVVDIFSNWSGGGTDCSLPMIWALENGKEYDVIIIQTDNETWAGKVHPIEALKKYRREMNLNTKLIVAGVTSTGFSIADPDDSGMLDIVGFDSSMPTLVSRFISDSF